MSPVFKEPTQTVKVERKSTSGFRLKIHIGSSYESWFDLTEEQYKELQEQMALLDDDKRQKAIEMLNEWKKEDEQEQPQPTGNGRIVLFEAITFANSYGHQHEWMCEKLLERATQGKTKYGTWLRTENGRNALQDVLDEALDGLMYATQLNMETPSYDAEELQRTFLEAAQLCKALMNKRKPLTQTFNELRAEFGQDFLTEK